MDENLSWRVHVPDQTYVNFKTITDTCEKINVAQAMGDFIVKRKDGIPAYQLASVVDDLELGVNLVVRGQDLWASTAAQLFLAQCLNAPIFPAARFVHHRLINDNSGNKLSKSAGSFSLKMLQKKNRRPIWIFRETAKALKLPFQEILTLDDLKEVFRSAALQKNGLLTILEQEK